MSKAPDLTDFSKEEIKETLNEIRHPFEVAVCNSDNYFNCGAIIRTSHNFLASKVWMLEDLERYYKKATMGARKWENVSASTTEQFLEMALEGGRNIIAMERRPGLQTINLIHYKWPENPIMVFGSEKAGVPEPILKAARAVVSIPVYGVLNDHNVATSAGITMYDWVSKNETY